MPADRWFRALNRSARPRLRLVCFPHAGGTAGLYRPWAPLIPPDVDAFAVRYPGREDRLKDPPATTMAELAGPIAAAVPELPGAPTVLFGHSMGGAVAYETALRLTRLGVPVVALFVSGRSAPGHEKIRYLAEAGEAELIQEIGLLGGTDTRAFDDPELRALVLRPIRADYRLLEAYTATPGALDVPIRAYYGLDDPDVDGDSVAPWSARTRSSFTVRAFPGGHFFIKDVTAELVGDVLATLSARH